MYEFFSGKSTRLELTGVRSVIAECYLIILHLDQAAVADGDAEDIGGQILEGGTTITHQLAMNNPILLPHFHRYLGK